MTKMENYNLSRSEWENLIDQWIFKERDRAILKRRLLDGKYKDEHSTANLQKLMVEILEFCRSVYASTRSEDERKIYHSMIEKLNK